jgi:hypothetical protein
MKGGKGLVRFQTSVSLKSRPSMWVRRLMFVIGLFIVIGTLSRPSGHEFSLFPGWSHVTSEGVLRPGRYREPGGSYSLVEGSGQDEGTDRMGGMDLVHDQRSVTSGIKSRDLI